MLIAKIVFGGQTGVDRGAIEAALEAGFPYGGLIPKGRLAEDGIVPEKFGIGLTGEVAKNEAEVAKKVAKNDTEVAKKIAEIKARVAGTVSAAEMRIIECIVEAPSISQAAIAERLGMTRQYIGRCMDDLQKRRIINRIGPKKGGHWELVEDKP